jgi:hypothetical protein
MEKKIIFSILFTTIFIYIQLISSQAFGAPNQEVQVLPVIEKPTVEYKADGLRDPFKGYQEEMRESMPQTPEQVILLAPPATLPEFKIQGTIWGGSIPQAIINNKVVKIGDDIEGAKIIGINKDGVKVIFDNREYNLSPPAKTNLENLKGGKDEKNF